MDVRTEEEMKVSMLRGAVSRRALINLSTSPADATGGLHPSTAAGNFFFVGDMIRADTFMCAAGFGIRAPGMPVLS